MVATYVAESSFSTCMSLINTRRGEAFHFHTFFSFLFFPKGNPSVNVANLQKKKMLQKKKNAFMAVVSTSLI